MKIRKIVTAIEDILSEEGRDAAKILRKVAVTAVCDNPCAGRYVENLGVLIDASGVIGSKIGGIAAGFIEQDGITSYGKGAVVGFNGATSMPKQSLRRSSAIRCVRLRAAAKPGYATWPNAARQEP